MMMNEMNEAAINGTTWTSTIACRVSRTGGIIERGVKAMTIAANRAEAFRCRSKTGMRRRFVTTSLRTTTKRNPSRTIRRPSCWPKRKSRVLVGQTCSTILKTSTFEWSLFTCEFSRNINMFTIAVAYRLFKGKLWMIPTFYRGAWKLTTLSDEQSKSWWRLRSWSTSFDHCAGASSVSTGTRT